jgi:CheY-like chemotaxis protein
MKGKHHVLIVDDDTDFITISKLVLEKHGYEVTTASNGDECLQKIESKKPDLIILDMIMTRPDEGFDVSRDLRNSEQTKHIPILMVTSVNDTATYRVGPDETWLPVDVFIEKPVRPEQLLHEVTTMLKG